MRIANGSASSIQGQARLSTQLYHVGSVIAIIGAAP